MGNLPDREPREKGDPDLAGKYICSLRIADLTNHCNLWIGMHFRNRSVPETVLACRVAITGGQVTLKEPATARRTFLLRSPHLIGLGFRAMLPLLKCRSHAESGKVAWVVEDQ